jgi:hypothetical protein
MRDEEGKEKFPEGFRHSGKRFTVIEQAVDFSIETRMEPSIDSQSTWLATDEIPQQSSPALFLTSSATGAIFDHIGWGTNTPENQVEQGGLILGRPFKDPRTNFVWALGELSMPALAATGSMAALEFSHKCWRDLLGRLDIVNEECRSELHVVGWYHTHPRHLSVFMSGTDQYTQRRFFQEDWHFAIVINPQEKSWRAFNGRNSQMCRGYMSQR